MQSRFLRLIGTTSMCAFAAAAVSPAQAMGITVISAAGCQLDSQLSPNGQPQDILHTAAGVRTRANLAQKRFVVCSLPRVWLSQLSSTGFIIDGTNLNGASTACTLSAWSFSGVLTQSYSFTSSDLFYEFSVQVPESVLPLWFFATLQCELPANGNGNLVSVTIET